jgi:hypothetical protein
MVIRSVGVLSLAKVAGVLYAIIGLIIGVCFAIFATIGVFGQSGAADDMPPFLGVLFGAGAIVFFPILYGVMAFVMFALLAALYNFIAGMIGGIAVDVQ